VESKSTRRRFLARAASASLVFGLSSCFGDDEDVLKPKILKAALRKMASNGKPGVIVRIPKDPTYCQSLGIALTEGSKTPSQANTLGRPDLGHPAYDMHELLVEAVVVCMDEAEIERCVRGAIAGESLILIDTHAARLDGVSLADAELATMTGLLAGARRVLHGETNKRLRQRGAGCFPLFERKPPDALAGFLSRPIVASRAEKGFDDLEQAGTAREEDFPANITNDQEVMEAAHLLRAFDPTLELAWARHVAEGAIGYLPFVIEERIESPAESTRLRARALIEAAYWLAMAKRDSEILPFGVEFFAPPEIRATPGSGSLSSCVGCGMASFTFGSRSRTFVKFVAR
jgi:hypothetical protein